MSTLADARRHHLQWLVICAGAIVASALLSVEPGGLTLPGLPRHPLPSLCVTRTVFHMNCPGCGMSRSFAAMAHGDLRAAFALHRLGPAVFLLVLLQVPLRAYAVLTGRLPHWANRRRLGDIIALALIVALFANWLLNVATGAIWSS